MSNNVYYSFWNTDAGIVRADHYDVDLNTLPSMAYVPFETVAHIKPDFYFSPDDVNRMISEGKIDALSVQMICHIAASKYLTLSQLAAFLEMRGLPHSNEDLLPRLDLLERGNFLRTFAFRVGSRTTITCYGIGFNGNSVAFHAGVFLHAGNRFVSMRRRANQNKPTMETPYEIRQALQANNLTLRLLRAGVPLEHYGIQETVRMPDGGGQTDAIVRSSATLRLSRSAHLMVEVVRRQHIRGKLNDKLSRFARMLSRPDFLHNVNINVSAKPRFVICAEDDAHALQIHRELADGGIFDQHPDLVILYTTDALIAQNPTSLFAFNADGKVWYSLPTRTGAVAEQAA